MSTGTKLNFTTPEIINVKMELLCQFSLSNLSGRRNLLPEIVGQTPKDPPDTTKVKRRFTSNAPSYRVTNLCLRDLDRTVPNFRPRRYVTVTSEPFRELWNTEPKWTFFPTTIVERVISTTLLIYSITHSLDPTQPVYLLRDIYNQRYMFVQTLIYLFLFLL